MKNRKGFTLIELLAIIVILTLIAVIITPIILGIIEDSKISAATDSAYGYKEAVGKYYASMLSQNHDFMLDGEYTIGNNGSISDGENTYDVLVSGTIPNSGYLNISKGSVISGCIQINEFAVTIEDKKVSSTTKGNCVEVPVEVVVEEFPTVTDTTPGIICGNGETEDYENSDTCYIYSVEDLVAFSNMVNSGKNFSGKTVMLMNGLDINEDKSYADVTTNQFGDVNGNGTTSTTLKEELTDTTAKGFKPIGNNSNKFSGTFQGNTKTIKNLFINRSSESNVGLFGYNTGTIKGLKLQDIYVKGNQYAGLIAGQNDGSITSIIAEGDASANFYVGLIAGKSTGTLEAIIEGNVNSTGSTAAVAGGMTGFTTGIVKGIYKSGTVTYSNGSNAGRTVGCTDGYYYRLTTVALDSVTLGGNTISNSNISDKNGKTVPANAINNIAINDAVIDTYIGGDNNNDGYYYDYDSNGKFTIYKLSERPLNITMSGSGTSEDPYIINNYNELKQVSYNLGTNGEKYYKLNADIDLTNKDSIMLGSGSESDATKRFTGVFDGNAHTINKLNLVGYDYASLFGYNTGTIKGLRLTNANVVGHDYVGLIAGYNTGSISSIIAEGNASGNFYIGLLSGKVPGSATGVVSGDISSSGSSASVAGGLAGFTTGTVKGIYRSGSVTYSNSHNVARTVGCVDDYYYTISTGALDTITLNGNTVSSSYTTDKNGKSYTASDLQTLAPYEEVGLNTSSTSGEYRYALDSNYNPYLIKN